MWLRAWWAPVRLSDGLVSMLGLGLLAFIAMAFSLSLDGYSSLIPFCALNGVALAVLLVSCRGLQGGVAMGLGGALACASAGLPPLVAVGYGTVAGLEIALGAWVLRKMKFSKKFERLSELLKFVITVVLCTVPGALLEALTQGDLRGEAPSAMVSLFGSGWVGRSTGLLFVSPSLWLLRPRLPQRFMEAALLVLLFVVTAMVAFTCPREVALPALLLLFPLSLWATLRFAVSGAALCGLGIFLTLLSYRLGSGSGDFVSGDLTGYLLSLGAAALALGCLVLGTMSAEQHEGRTALARAQEQLLAADRVVAVGTLAAGMGHEINNPLTHVLSCLQLAQQHLQQPKASWVSALTQVGQALEGVERIQIIVEDLQRLTQPDGGARVPVTLEALVPVALRMACPSLRDRGRVISHLAPAPQVLAHEGRLGQVLLNLLINAAQALPESTAERNEIHVSTGTAPDGRAFLEVRDNGCGIPADILPRIFEPFFTTKTSGEGTGLGLSICQHIVQSYGGQLVAQSLPGEGSTFRLLLPPAPLVRAHDAAAESTPRPLLPARRGRILIIDDEARLAQTMRLLLEPEHEVFTTTLGREALEWVEAGQRFDLVFCDLHMEGTSGVEVYRQLEQTSPALAGRLVFISGGAYCNATREFIRSVHNEVLQKPVRPEVLIATVEAVMAREPALLSA